MLWGGGGGPQALSWGGGATGPCAGLAGGEGAAALMANCVGECVGGGRIAFMARIPSVEGRRVIP